MRDVLLHVQFLLTVYEARRRSKSGVSCETRQAGRMIAPLVLYLSLLAEHQTLLRENMQAQHNLNSSDGNRTVSSKTDFTQIPAEAPVTTTGKYEETVLDESPRTSSDQELFKLNSTSEENPYGDETGFLKTTKAIPSRMIGYYQTNFSHSTVLKGKIRKVFLR